MNNEVEVLLVEDNHDEAMLTIRSLKKNNLANRLLHLDDGEEALDFLFARNKYANRRIEDGPQLILLDLKLPKVDGLDILRTIKSDPRTRTIPVVVLTSSKQEQDIVASYELGVNSYIVKPVNFDSFAKVVVDADFIQKILQRSKFEIDARVVDTREDFVASIRAFVPDVILSDHSLPNFSSLEALEISRGALPFVPFILVTGAVSEEFAASIIRAGADDYVLKNNLKRLPTAIRQAIERKHTELSLIRSTLEKEKAEQDLKSAHERLVFHIENGPLGFIEYDENFHIKSWSKRAEGIFGWKEEDAVTGRIEGMNQVYEEDLPKVSLVARDLVSGKVDRNSSQNRNYTKDGRVIWCEWFNSALKDEGGKVTTIMSLVQDITEKRLAEQQREFDQNNMRSLINNTHDLMWSVDRDLNIITSNAAFSDVINKLSGVEGLEKGLQLLREQVPDEQRRRFYEFYQRAFKGEIFTVTEFIGLPSHYWRETSYYPIRQGSAIIGTACFSRDVTLKKLEENRLKLLESVVTHATDSVLITEHSQLDEPGPRIVYINDAFLNMTGYTKEEIMDRSPRFLQGPLTDTRELKRLREALEKNEPCEIEVVNYKKNGDSFWVNMSVAPVQDNSGKPSHFIAIERDVTERRKTLQAIKEQNAKLRDIAWTQSHVVRGPLARIMGLVNLLSNYSPCKDDPSTKELIHYLKISANELDEVVKEIVREAEEIGDDL